MDENQIFDKTEESKKKKRVLTDAQKEGLARGRAKVKANREAKKQTEIAKQVEEVKSKKLLEKDKALEKEQKQQKKELLSRQEQTRQKIKQREAEHKVKIDAFNELKYKCMEHCETEKEFDTMDKLLNKYITKGDILKGDDHLRTKIGALAVQTSKRYGKSN